MQPPTAHATAGPLRFRREILVEGEQQVVEFGVAEQNVAQWEPPSVLADKGELPHGTGRFVKFREGALPSPLIDLDENPASIPQRS